MNALFVEHQGEFKMVGKTFLHQGREIFYHEHSTLQTTFAIRSPGAIDRIVLYWLRLRSNVDRVFYHYLRGKGSSVAPLESFFSHPVYRLGGDRDRLILHQNYWHGEMDPHPVPRGLPEVRLSWDDLPGDLAAVMPLNEQDLPAPKQEETGYDLAEDDFWKPKIAGFHALVFFPEQQRELFERYLALMSDTHPTLKEHQRRQVLKSMLALPDPKARKK